MPLSSQLLRRYRNKHFVETGTCVGDGVRCALDAGFEHIYSIEISEKLHAQNIETFREDHRVSLFCGNSETMLAQIIAKIEEPITFWLDAHYSGGVTEMADSNCPIMKELQTIINHRVGRHTILIDDVRLFGKNYLLHDELRGFSESQRKDFLFESIEIEAIQEMIRQANPKYRFRYEDGHVKDDVLAAFVPDGAAKIRVALQSLLRKIPSSRPL